MTYEERYWRDKEKERKHQEKQIYAYEHRDDIKLGDKFLWRISDCSENRDDSYDHGYITSGRLGKKCIWTKKGDKFWKQKQVLKICRVYEGHNGYGPFVDYWLSPSGLVETETEESGKNRLAVIIINGPDARKMKRVSPEHKREESKLDAQNVAERINRILSKKELNRRNREGWFNGKEKEDDEG